MKLCRRGRETKKQWQLSTYKANVNINNNQTWPIDNGMAYKGEQVGFPCSLFTKSSRAVERISDQVMSPDEEKEVPSDSKGAIENDQRPINCLSVNWRTSETIAWRSVYLVTEENRREGKRQSVKWRCAQMIKQQKTKQRRLPAEGAEWQRHNHLQAETVLAGGNMTESEREDREAAFKKINIHTNRQTKALPDSATEEDKWEALRRGEKQWAQLDDGPVVIVGKLKLPGPNYWQHQQESHNIVPVHSDKLIKHTEREREKLPTDNFAGWGTFQSVVMRQ